MGLNENIVIYNQEATDVFSTCNSLLRDNHSGDWNRYFSKTSYGPWLILLVIAYFILLLTFVMLVIGPHYSCLVYGKPISVGHTAHSQQSIILDLYVCVAKALVRTLTLCTYQLPFLRYSQCSKIQASVGIGILSDSPKDTLLCDIGCFLATK